jgi:hypothetical protein
MKILSAMEALFFAIVFLRNRIGVSRQPTGVIINGEVCPVAALVPSAGAKMETSCSDGMWQFGDSPPIG